MAIQVRSWHDLAEKTYFLSRSITIDEIKEMGLKFKPQKNFSSLIKAINSIDSQLNYFLVIAKREDVLKEYLEGDLSDEHELT